MLFVGIQNQTGQNPDIIRIRALTYKHVVIYLEEERYMHAEELSNATEILGILAYYDKKNTPSDSNVDNYTKFGSIT